MMWIFLMGRSRLEPLKKIPRVGNKTGLSLRSKSGLLILVALLIMFLIPGCNSEVSAGNQIKVSGAWDVISPFQRKIIPGFNTINSIPVEADFSSSALQQVEEGKSDVALLGVDPKPDELKGLSDTVIAYDAVCIIIDANSYSGGEYDQNQTPVRKTTGFQNLTLEDLKQIMQNFITPFGKRWWWSYESWGPTLDLDTGSYSDNESWLKDYKAIFPQLRMIPGKYDTQTLLYQKLGLNEDEIAETWNNQFTEPKLDAEEEVLSIEYVPGAPYDAGSGDFTYKIGAVSRRVIPVAMQHVPIKVISINGIDPLEDTEAIYNGKYPFSRKIHIVTRTDCPASVSQLKSYLLSPAGQKALVNAGYLSLP